MVVVCQCVTPLVWLQEPTPTTSTLLVPDIGVAGSCVEGELLIDQDYLLLHKKEMTLTTFCLLRMKNFLTPM